MAKDPLQVAMIGVGGFGRFTLQALSESDRVKLVGLADKDATLAEQAASDFDVPAYGDNRSMLAECHPQAVFLALPPADAAAIIATCAERGIHVWKELPLARNLVEGLAIVKQMEAAGLKLAVGTQRRFAGGYQAAKRLRADIGEVFLARAHYLFNWGGKLGWRGDKASAGGGVLLEVGYHLVDLLVWLLGLPQEVYGFSVQAHSPEPVEVDGQTLPLYDTEDTASALLRYEAGCMATMVTTRRAGPLSEAIILHGHNGSVAADTETCVLHDRDGAVVDRSAVEAAPIEAFRRQIEAFTDAVASNAKTYPCSGRENLLNLAVIEAIYLSNQTGQGESPQRLLQTQGLDVQQCLVCRPVAAETPQPGTR